MANKMALNSFFNLSRRSYAALTATENNVQKTIKGSMMKKVSDSGNMGIEILTESKEIFWMKDPRTGNWIPENHFGDIDVADLRDKFLSKK